MQIFIQSNDPGALNAIVKGPFVPMKTVDSVEIPKDWDEMTEDEKRKVQYDLKAKNMITSGLSSDEFFRLLGAKVPRKSGKCLK